MRQYARAQMRSLVVVVCVMGSAASMQAHAAVGRTPTSADVSASGEATYSIPIFAPSGTHGLTPQLAFTYGHRNGGTLLGTGWSIAGLSAITRCPRSWAADGEPREVRNDANDRFCLDGNKLRLTAGTYGQPNATYQTEIETFSRITSIGVAGNGPASFIVEGKNGLYYDYGATEDSRIQSVGQASARAWALSAIRDRSGNAIHFVYGEDTTNGAYHIDWIDYTVNVDQLLTAQYRIDFEWQTKPSNEIDSGYLAGSRVKEVTRLDYVDVLHNGAIVRRYDLSYEGALSSTSRSRLASIQECAGASLDCLPPTTFAYQDGTSGLSGEVSMGMNMLTTPWPLDVNGDGRDDLVYSSTTTSGTGHWMVMFGNSSGGYSSPTNTGVTNTNFLGATPIDYNADGREDLLVPYSGGTWWVMLGSASGLSAPSNTSAPATGTGANARAFDVNGDGLDDLVWADLVGYAGGDVVRYRLRQWGGTFSPTVYTLAGPMSADQRIESGVFGAIGQAGPQRNPDFNGDGRGDIVYRRTTRVWNDGTGQWTYVRELVVVCPGGWSASVTNPNASGAPYYGDANGDGKSDLFYLNQLGSLSVRFSTGAGLTAELAIGGGSAGWTILDWDSDGYDDVLISSSGAWQLRRSTGESFAAAVSTGMTAGTRVAVADINGDGLHDLASLVGSDWRYRTHAGAYPDLLQTAMDGFGNALTFNYTSIVQGSYSKDADAAFPEQDYQDALYVVSSNIASNGVGGTFTNSYLYYGARLHLQGRGLEGFRARRVHDSRNGLYKFDYFHRLFPHTGAVFQSDVFQPNGSTLISRMQATWNAHPEGSGAEFRRFPHVSSSSVYRYEVGGAYNGALISTISTSNSLHTATGVIYDSTTTITEASSANGVQAGASYVQRVLQPTAYLTNNTSSWCIGRPGRIEATNSHGQYGGASITRTTTIDWDESKCRPDQIVMEPGHAQLQVTRTLGYDGFGNVDSDSVTGVGMTSRTTSANWGSRGQFPETVTNALSQTTELDWNYALGVKTREADPNGIATTWQHDAFGRRTREDRPDETYSIWSIQASSGVCDPRARSYVVVRQYATGGSEISEHFVFRDAFDRPINEYRTSFAGSSTYHTVIRTFDALGRLASEGAPYVSGGCPSYSSPHSTFFQYDLLGRPTEISRPVSDSDASEQTTYSYYEGLTTRVVDALSKESKQIANVAGALARSVDHDGYYQSFDFDPFGNAVRVTDSAGNTLQSNAFNIRGMRTAQADMDAGSWSYTPNALGEVVSQTDANGATTNFQYDDLGRPRFRYEPDAGGTTTTQWTWGSSAGIHNIGRLERMQVSGSAAADYWETYGYDSVGRLALARYTEIGSATDYDVELSYSSTTGFLDTLTYPTSTSGYRLKLQYEYQNGRLARVKDYNAPSTTFWTANAMDARGNVIDETLGNGIQTVRGYDGVTGLLDFIQSGPGANGTIQDLTYEWDRVGNLTLRRDERQNLTENFYYDNLHRLISTTGPSPITIAYNAMGNITSKTGVGAYTYHATRKHAVVSTGAPGSFSFSYDNNGNQITRNGQSVSWFVSNQPRLINGAPGYSSEFHYTPSRARWLQIANYNGTIERTVSIGGLLDKVTRGSETSWRHYIAGASGPVAIYTRKSTGANELHYLTKDHLGSIDSITDASGGVEVRLSFGVDGKRRNEDTWSGNPTSGDWTDITNTTRRGYTGHEMLDNLNLTHMNGRVYDQVIGRFVSADPFIDGPGLTAGWNRYSYVHNSPLSFTDPSGYTKVTIPWINYDLPDWFFDRGNGLSGLAPDGSGGGGGGHGSPVNDSDKDDDAEDDDETEIEEVVVKAPKCPEVPQAPLGVDIDVNIRVAATRNTTQAPSISTPYGGTRNPGLSSGAIWFYNQVNYGGPWDYKTQNPPGTQMYTDFGNFNFGATGRAVGFTADQLLWGAGLAQLRRDIQTGVRPQSPGTKFDNPDDAQPITDGIQYYDNHCY